MRKTIFALLLLSMFSCRTVIETSTIQPSEENIGFYYLPSGILKIQIIKTGDKKNYELNCKALTFPDINQKYYLKYKQSSNSHDILNFEFDDNNYLKKIKIDTDDATDELIVKIADIATAYSKTKGLLTPGDLNEQNEREEIDTICTIYHRVDDAISTLNEKLKKYKYKVYINEIYKKDTADNVQITEQIYSGIYFKPTIPYIVEIENTKTQRSESFTYYLPDTEIAKFDISRAAFVQKITELEFKNGQISKFSINKPSQSLELVSVPIEILENIIALPSELIQLKIDLSSKNKDLYNEQKEEAEAKQALEELFRILKEEKEEKNKNENSGDPYK